MLESSKNKANTIGVSETWGKRQSDTYEYNRYRQTRENATYTGFPNGSLNRVKTHHLSLSPSTSAQCDLATLIVKRIDYQYKINLNTFVCIATVLNKKSVGKDANYEYVQDYKKNSDCI